MYTLVTVTLFFILYNKPQAQGVTDLYDDMIKYFGSYEAFREQFTGAAASVFGSGYAWLVQNGAGELSIITTANQVQNESRFQTVFCMPIATGKSH